MCILFSMQWWNETKENQMIVQWHDYCCRKYSRKKLNETGINHNQNLSVFSQLASLTSYFRTSWMALVVSMVKLENVNIHGFIHGGALNHPINRVDDRRIGSRTVRTHVLPSLKTNETLSHTSVGWGDVLNKRETQLDDYKMLQFHIEVWQINTGLV